MYKTVQFPFNYSVFHLAINPKQTLFHPPLIILNYYVAVHNHVINKIPPD